MHYFACMFNLYKKRQKNRKNEGKTYKNDKFVKKLFMLKSHKMEVIILLKIAYCIIL